MNNKLNREERRKLQREQRKQQTKVKEPPIRLLISCPECGSIDVSQIRHDYFKCNNCGAEHITSEMSCNL